MRPLALEALEHPVQHRSQIARASRRNPAAAGPSACRAATAAESYSASAPRQDGAASVSIGPVAQAPVLLEPAEVADFPQRRIDDRQPRPEQLLPGEIRRERQRALARIASHCTRVPVSGYAARLQCGHNPRKPFADIVLSNRQFSRNASAVKIALVTPAAAGTRHGNREYRLALGTLAARARPSRRRPAVVGRRAADVMIALHARRSHESIARFARAFPGAPAGGRADRHRSLPRHPRRAQRRAARSRSRPASSCCRRWASPSCPPRCAARRASSTSPAARSSRPRRSRALRGDRERPSARGKGSLPLRRCARAPAAGEPHRGHAHGRRPRARRWRGKRGAGRARDRATAGWAACRTGGRCACSPAAG